jgi:hypothetical protein
MSVELRPMRSDEFPAWKAESVAAYATDMHENAGVPAEGLAREQGLDRIELHVVGGNEVARGLYRSLAYDEVAVYMGKSL